jgi:hypothetical protein
VPPRFEEVQTMRHLVVELPVGYEIACPNWGTHYPHVHGQGYVCPGTEGGRLKIYRLRQPGCNFLVVDSSGEQEFARQAELSGAQVVEVNVEPAFTMIWQGHRRFCGFYHSHLPHRTGKRDYCPGWAESGSGLLIGEQVYLIVACCMSKFVVISIQK